MYHSGILPSNPQTIPNRLESRMFPDSQQNTVIPSPFYAENMLLQLIRPFYMHKITFSNKV